MPRSNTCTTWKQVGGAADASIKSDETLGYRSKGGGVTNRSNYSSPVQVLVLIYSGGNGTDVL